MNLNLSQPPYTYNNYHHLKQFPSKSASSRHHTSHGHVSKNPILSLNESHSDASNVPLVRFYRNVSAPLNSPPITSSYSSAALLPTAVATAATTTIMPSLLNRSTADIVDWSMGRLQTLNGSMGSLSLIDSTTPLESPVVIETSGQSGNAIVLDSSEQDYYLRPESMDTHTWPTANDIPILIGAAAGGLVLLIILIILLLIWNCCDTNNRCRRGDNNNGSERSNRSSLSRGSCSSGSGSSKRHSSNLYINNPNSLDAEAAGCDSLDVTGHYHYSNYDYGPGPGGGVAQLVIQNVRVLDSAAIPRSVSVPLSRSNSHSKSSGSTIKQQPSSYLTSANPNFAGSVVVTSAAGGTESRSHLSQALTRNIATYYETQRKKNAKSSKSAGGGGGGNGGNGLDKSSVILNDLSLNMDMAGHNLVDPYGNVIISNQESTPWVLLDDDEDDAAVKRRDVEANKSHPDFYRTRSLPWPQSSRSSGRSVSGVSQRSGPAQESSLRDSSATIHAGTTTMGRVNFTKKRRNRMRLDSAAAIALNRSGFSLDWDFNDDDDDGRETIVQPVISRVVTSNRPSVSSFSSANNTSATDRTIDLSTTTATTSSNSQAPISSSGDMATRTEPDSPDFIPEAIVVYNERTAL